MNIRRHNIIISFNYILLGVCLIITSCQQKPKDKRTLLLTNGNFKYWDISDTEMSHYGAYRFDIDSTCFYVHYDKSMKMNYGYERKYWWLYKWYFLGSDSIVLTAGGNECKIVKFSEDTIILVHRQAYSDDEGMIKFKPKNEILTQSKDQMDRQDFKKFKKENKPNIISCEF